MYRSISSYLAAACVIALLVELLMANAAAPAGASNSGRPPAQATSPVVCSWTFEDTFPYREPAPSDPLLRTWDGVTIGGEYYTSTGSNNPGVRLRDFRDSLDPARRPDGGDYTAHGAWTIPAPAGGLAIDPPGGIAGVGVRMGGQAQIQSVPPRHSNTVGLLHLLPSMLQNTTRFYFEYDWAMETANLVPPYEHLYTSGGNSVHLGGHNAGTGHLLYYALGYGATSPGEIHAGAVDYTIPQGLWDVRLGQNLPADQNRWYHGEMRGIGDGTVLMSYDGAVTQSDPNLANMIDRPDHISLNVSIGNRNSVVWTRYRNVWFTWVTEGFVESVSVPRPAGTTYRTFDAVAQDGIVDFYLVNPVTGARTPIQPGDPIPAAYNTTGLRLRAQLYRRDATDPSPVLVSWRVSTCLPATPTAMVPPTRTPTGTPIPPTPTSTPRPSSTPRPTVTPGGYFQIAPLKPAVHLKVDPVLGPPPPPYDQTDWRESDAIYYPLQVYAGLVPFAYADPGTPPRLCYWTAHGWACVNGTIQLQSYTLRGIELGNVNYLDQPIKVVYARPHFFQKWHLPEYAFTQSEYTFVNWLAPDGVPPTCGSGYRCVNLDGVGVGNYEIVYDVTGNIHWDAIPGVGGPYNYEFSNSYRVPIGIAMPRAEP
jgi:hypothetical protein